MSDDLFTELGLHEEYLRQRCLALWRHSPDARDAVTAAMDHVGVTNPIKANAQERLDLALRLFDLEGTYPGATDEALTATANIAGELVGATGNRKDCASLARSWFPEVQDEVWAGFSDARKAKGATR